MKLLLVDLTAVFSIHITDQVYKQIPGNYFAHMLEFKTTKCGKGWEHAWLPRYIPFFTLTQTLRAPNGIVQFCFWLKYTSTVEIEICQPDKVLKGKTFIWTAKHSLNSIWWQYYAASFRYTSKEAFSFTKLACSRLSNNWGKWKTGQVREKAMRNCLSFFPTQLFETWNRLLPSIIGLYT